MKAGNDLTIGRQMTETLTNEDLLAFCDACSWTFQAWSIHRGFQDRLPGNSELVRKHGYLLQRLSIITQEYTLQQIAKLHDPTGKPGQFNLGISFIVERGCWDDETQAILKGMRDELGELPKRLLVARNKVLAHHDRDNAIASRALGEFPEGMDDTYFETLQAFVNLVHHKRIGGPYPFDDLAKVDTEAFVEALRCGVR